MFFRFGLFLRLLGIFSFLCRLDADFFRGFRFFEFFAEGFAVFRSWCRRCGSRFWFCFRRKGWFRFGCWFRAFYYFCEADFLKDFGDANAYAFSFFYIRDEEDKAVLFGYAVAFRADRFDSNVEFIANVNGRGWPPSIKTISELHLHIHLGGERGTESI